MTGIYIGVKNNSYLKHWIKSDFILTKESIILGTFIKSVEKISYRKMSNGIRKRYRKKEKLKMPLNITSYHLLIIYPANTLFSWKNLKELKIKKKLFGL
jgi:hypothetical protein